MKGIRSLTAIAALGIAASMHAQEPRRLAQPDSVPIDLATALASTGGIGGDPLILVGAMPEWAANLIVVPPKGRVLGSAYVGTSVVGIVSVPSTADSLVVQTMTALRAKGWAPPPPSPNFGGFRPAGSMMAYGGIMRSGTLCMNDLLLTLTSSITRGSTNLVYRLNGNGNFSQCRPQQQSIAMSQPAFPTLYNPPDNSDPRLLSECYQGNGLSRSTGTQLRSTMGVDSIIEHYARQMRDSGWKPAAVVGAASASRSFTRPDTGGTVLEATILVSSHSVNCREATLQVRLRKP